MMLGDSVRRRRRGRASVDDGSSHARKRRGGRRTLWQWLVAAVLVPFGVGYAVAALVLFPPTDEASALEGGVPAPELIGETTGDAEQELAALGLGALEAMELPHPDAAPGEIIAQDPLPGQHLRAGAGMRVAVSSGPPRARVPDVVGFPLERARALLQRLGFEVASVERLSDTPTGRVTAITPEPGSEQRLPATVTVVVSIGRPADLDAPPVEPQPDSPADTAPDTPVIAPPDTPAPPPAPPDTTATGRAVR
ncbi:MAG: PASTA domain-containing protein [Longimicrobiales bacterium]